MSEGIARRQLWVVAAWVAFVPSALIVYTLMVLGILFGMEGLERDPWPTIAVFSSGVFVVSGTAWFKAEFLHRRPPRHVSDDDSSTTPRWGYNAELVWWLVFLIGVPIFRVAEAVGLDTDVRVVLGLVVYPAWIVSTVLALAGMVIGGRRARHARRRDKAAPRASAGVSWPP